MMSKAGIIALAGCNFCGWVLILASACYNQNKVGREALNFPLDWYGSDQSTVEKWAETGSKIMLGAAAKWPAYGTSNLNLVLSSAALTPGGRALSYLWWITVFQFTGIALGAAAIHKKELRTGVVGLFAVLTASTFIYTADVFSAPKTGLFSLTHDKDLKIVVPNSDNNPAMYAYYKGLATLSAGLLIVDICNVLTMLLLPTVSEEVAAAKEAPAAEKEASAV